MYGNAAHTQSEGGRLGGDLLMKINPYFHVSRVSYLAGDKTDHLSRLWVGHLVMILTVKCVEDVLNICYSLYVVFLWFVQSRNQIDLWKRL